MNVFIISQDMQPLRLFPQSSHTSRTSPVRHSKRVISASSVEDTKESAGKQLDVSPRDQGKRIRTGH